MSISKVFGWISLASVLAGIAWIAFTMISWTLGDPKADLLIEALTFFSGPVWWILLLAAASFGMSAFFKRIGE
jgi:hypothetical protein